MQYAVNIMPSPVIKDVASTHSPPSDPKTPMLRASSRLIWHGNEKWARLGWSESQQCILYQRKKETKIGVFYLKKQRHFGIDMMFIIILCTLLNHIHTYLYVCTWYLYCFHCERIAFLPISGILHSCWLKLALCLCFNQMNWRELTLRGCQLQASRRNPFATPQVSGQKELLV